jgi:hypothetical protein
MNRIWFATILLLTLQASTELDLGVQLLILLACTPMLVASTIMFVNSLRQAKKQKTRYIIQMAFFGVR